MPPIGVNCVKAVFSVLAKKRRKKFFFEKKAPRPGNQKTFDSPGC
jgi:hypothetical protein